MKRRDKEIASPLSRGPAFGLLAMTDVKRPKVLFLVGPTAAGKSEAAVRLAEEINAEIISCDSMQVYKGMDIGTQKPPLDWRKRVRHHMIDILPPDKEFSAADFRRRALGIINDIHKRGRLPLFVGGTGLYMKALIDGLFPSPPKDEGLRKKLYRQARRYGAEYIHKKLKRVDAETAGRIHPNDIKKTIRALEIYYTAGKKPSALKAATRPLTAQFDIKIFGLTRPRQELYKRINERVERMFEEGFLDEVKRVAKRKLSITAAQAIGYKEAMSYLRKQVSKKRMDSRFCGNDNFEIFEIEVLKELIKRDTRRYAKRQLTWFRKDKRINWIEIHRRDRSRPGQLLGIRTCPRRDGCIKITQA